MCEEGSHDELMNRGGLYAGLYESQGMSLSVIGDVDGIGKSVVRVLKKKKKRKRKRKSDTVHTAAERLRYTDNLAFGCNRGSVHRSRCRVESRMRKQRPL